MLRRKLYLETASEIHKRKYFGLELRHSQVKYPSLLFRCLISQFDVTTTERDYFRTTAYCFFETDIELLQSTGYSALSGVASSFSGLLCLIKKDS